MKLFDVISVDEALDIMKKTFNINLEVKSVSLIESLNKYISCEIKSKVNVPHFRKSLVDGYAVIFKDIISASDTNPMPMNLIGESVMGKTCTLELQEQECVYVPTGSMIPENAEGVVMIEYCEKLNDKEIIIQKNVAFNENIVQIGEDIKEDEILYNKGHFVNERDLGVLAGANIKSVNIYEELVVGIISTGDEILNLDEDISEAKIKDINAYILYGQLKNIGVKPIIYPPVKDNLDEIIKLMEKAIKECDLVLISGGSSVGKKDETLKAIESFEDSEVLVEGIAIKPGKPTIIANIDNKCIIGLPGHPLSCAFVVESIVKPYIKDLYSNYNEKYILCEFEYNYHKAKGRQEVLSVNINIDNNKVKCNPIFAKSSTIKQFANCDGYVKIDRDVEGINKGDLVKVYLF